jgi:hypothetical protein
MIYLLQSTKFLLENERPDRGGKMVAKNGSEERSLPHNGRVCNIVVAMPA